MARVYLENFKNLLIRNHSTHFNIIWQECSYGDSLPSLFKLSWFVINMAVRGWGLFTVYSYIKHFKNIFVRNHWIDFNITWQNCSFGDPLSRFSSSQYDAWKKTMAAGEQGYKIYTKILEQCIMEFSLFSQDLHVKIPSSSLLNLRSFSICSILRIDQAFCESLYLWEQRRVRSCVTSDDLSIIFRTLWAIQ